jgi:hypothetical protein
VRTPAPVTAGVNWYSDFDHPIKDKDGKYWIGKNPDNIGSIRGGHCVCIPYLTSRDLTSWYHYYDQGSEGACVGFGSSRMMSLLNRKQFDPWWLWNQAKIVDEWADTNPGDDNGTSVRAAMDILRLKGHVLKRKTTPTAKEGILENRWATKIDDLFTVLQNDTYKNLGALPFLNSWGTYYPRVVWMPCETWDRLMKEDGETMVTDLTMIKTGSDRF